MDVPGHYKEHYLAASFVLSMNDLDIEKCIILMVTLYQVSNGLSQSLFINYRAVFLNMGEPSILY